MRARKCRENGLGVASSASRSFTTPHTTAPHLPFIDPLARACSQHHCGAFALGRASMHTLVCRCLKNVCRRAREKDCGEYTLSSRVAARGAVQAKVCRVRVLARGAVGALGSACGAGTRTHSQHELRYKSCAQLPEHSSEPIDTHIKLCVSRRTYACYVIHVYMSYFIVCDTIRIHTDTMYI